MGRDTMGRDTMEREYGTGNMGREYGREYGTRNMGREYGTGRKTPESYEIGG